MKIDIKDDLRQSIVIARNEIKKFFTGKKIIIFSVLMLLITALIAIVPYAFGNGYDNATEVTISFAGFLTFIVMLAGVLFTATSIVSEYEERTALILFTRPIRKWSIYLGKILASMVVVVTFVAIYYIFIAVYSLGVTGEVEGDMLTSFGLCVCAVFGVTGVSMVLSSIAKKGSTASILALVVLLLVFSVIIGVLEMTDVNNDWILTQAMESITSSLGDYDGDELVASTTDVGYNAGVMLGWGLVCCIVGFFLFKKRDF